MKYKNLFFDSKVEQTIFNCCSRVKYLPREVNVSGFMNYYLYRYELQIIIDDEQLVMSIPETDFYTYPKRAECIIEKKVIKLVEEAKAKFLIKHLAGVV